MIALDTNVLVRFLVEDDAAQAARATALISSAIALDEPLYVSDVVLCETVWVLSAAYELPRAEIAGVLSQLVRTRHLRFENSDRVARCVRDFESGRGDFADYVIRRTADDAGFDAVATFDKVLLKEAGFFAP